jgi:D-alanine-D-alanine ligase
MPSERLEEIADLAIRAHHAISCSGYSRSDFLILPDSSAVWLECNTLPGLSPQGNLATMAEAASISYDELIKILMATAVQEGYRP